jgi:translocator protein
MDVTARRQPAWLVYAAFFVLTAAAASMGALFGPGAWYTGLVKPTFNPPNWVFAPVWTLLYIMIAIAGARAWLAGASQAVMNLWLLQLVLNAAWTLLFFGLKRPDLALVDIVLMLFTIATFAIKVLRVSPLSAALFVPYFAWVGFATALNFAIWRLN